MNIIIVITFIVLLIVILLNKKKEFFTNKISISVFSLFRNNESYLPYYFKKMEKFEQKYDMYYYFYENDSTDNTKELLKEFMKNRKGNLVLETLKNKLTTNEKTMSNGISMNRGSKMAYIRNLNKKSAKDNNTNYSIVIDSEVYFNSNIIDKMIKSINKNNKIAMITPFNICYETYSYQKHPIHYYDSLAFITNDNLSHKQTANTCLFDICYKCINHRKIYNVNINKNKLLSVKKNIKVNSAFGGFVLLKSDIFNKVKWGNTICEHHYFCEMVRNLGYNIIVNPKIITTTNAIDNKPVNNNLIKKILQIDFTKDNLHI